MTELSDLFSPALLELIAQLVDERVAAGGGTGSPWLDAAGAADYLAVPVKRIRNLTAAGDIPHVKRGRPGVLPPRPTRLLADGAVVGAAVPRSSIYDAEDNLNAPAALARSGAGQGRLSPMSYKSARPQHGGPERSTAASRIRTFRREPHVFRHLRGASRSRRWWIERGARGAGRLPAEAGPRGACHAYTGHVRRGRGSVAGLESGWRTRPVTATGRHSTCGCCRAGGTPRSRP